MVKQKKRKTKPKKKPPARAKTTPAQHQFIAIHNSALSNQRRDQAEIQRKVAQEERELNLSTIKLQKELIEKKLSLL